MSWLINAVRYVNLEDLHEIFTKTTWDLTQRDSEGHTCVEYLIYLDDDDCCAVMEVMFDHGVTPDQLILGGLQVMEHFILTKKEKQIEVMLKYGGSPNLINSCVGMAVFNDYCTILQMLLDHGGDPNFKYFDGQTQLHVAVPFRHKCAQILLDKGADPNIANSYGKTAKMVAVDAYDQKMVDLFESYAVDIKEPDSI